MATSLFLFTATTTLGQSEDAFGDAGADPVKLFERGQNAHARKEFEKAIEYYDEAIKVRPEFGEAEFKCQAGKIPLGMIFVPYGPPTCKLMGGDTDGTGMPTSKGWEVEVVPCAN